MYDYDLNELTRLTGLSPTRREELIRYHAKLPETVRIEAVKIQLDLMRQNKKERRKDKESEYVYANLLIALHKMQSIETATQRKQQLAAADLDKIEHIKKERRKAGAARKPRQSKKYEQIEIQFYELIKQLRQENLSWRAISDYIERFHRKSFNHAYLKECYEKITASKEQIAKMQNKKG